MMAEVRELPGVPGSSRLPSPPLPEDPVSKNWNFFLEEKEEELFADIGEEYEVTRRRPDCRNPKNLSKEQLDDTWRDVCVATEGKKFVKMSRKYPGSIYAPTRTRKFWWAWFEFAV